MATTYWISTSSTSFSTNANWSSGTAPANGDTFVFNGLGTASVLTDLGTVLTGTTMIVEKSYAGSIGVLSGATATYLVLDGGTAHFEQGSGQGSGPGSPLLMVNYGSTAAVVNIYDSASTSSTTYYPPILIKGSSLTVNHSGGTAGVAQLPGETATLTALKMLKGVNPSVTPSMYLGTGVTTTLLTAALGTVLNRSNQTQTTVTLSGTAQYNYDGTGAHTTLNVNKGSSAIYSGTGTITTLNLYGGTFDREKDPRALTITNTNLYNGCAILLNNGVASSTTRTNPVAFVGCGIQDIRATTPSGERL
jgi:hypothetical protein